MAPAARTCAREGERAAAMAVTIERRLPPVAIAVRSTRGPEAYPCPVAATGSTCTEQQDATTERSRSRRNLDAAARSTSESGAITQVATARGRARTSERTRASKA